MGRSVLENIVCSEGCVQKFEPTPVEPARKGVPGYGGAQGGSGALGAKDIHHHTKSL